MREFIKIIEESQQPNILNLRKGFVINPSVTDKVIRHQQITGAQQDVYGFILVRGCAPSVAKWFSSTFLNAMTRRITNAYSPISMPLGDYLDLYLDLVSETEDSRGTKREILNDLPEWSKNGVILFPFGFEALVANMEDDGISVPLHEVNEPYNFDELIDFVNFFAQTRERSLNRLSAADAVKLSNKWHAVSENLAGSDTGNEIMVFPDGFRILQLVTTNQLDYESKHCRHCIGKGGYDYELTREDGKKIFSLRDDKNIPIVTISVIPDTRMIDQMQAYENTAPPEHVFDHLKSFMVAAHLRFRNAEQAKRNFGIETKIDF